MSSEEIDWPRLRAAAVAIGIRKAARQAARDLPPTKTQNFISLAVLASAGLIFAGCAAPPGLLTTYVKTFQVVSPITEPRGSIEGYTRNNNDQISILVKFNRSVDKSTVIEGKTLILYFAKDHNTAVDLVWTDQDRVLTITTHKSLAELANFTPDIHFALTLKGDPPNAQIGVIGQPQPPRVVRSADGLILDGDHNFQAGGDYVASFVIVG